MNSATILNNGYIDFTLGKIAKKDSYIGLKAILNIIAVLFIS